MEMEQPASERHRLDRALEHNPGRFFVELKNLIRRRMGFAAAARHTHLNRESLYKALSMHGNPRFDSLERILNLLGYRLSIAPLEDRLANDKRAAAMARKYVWWQPSDRTLADRRLLLAQMMTLGTADDVRWLLSCVSTADLRRVLRNPPVGAFNRRSWNFWHRRLVPGPVPELPSRHLPLQRPRQTQE